MKHGTAFVMMLAALLLGLSACSFPGGATPEPTKPDAEAVFTAAAQTAEAMRKERAARTSTPPVEELIASAAAPSPTPTVPTPTQTFTPTVDLTAETTDASVAGGEDKAEFVEDVSVPDGARFKPGKQFEKTWRLRNIGKTTWTTAYSLVFIDGDLMGASPAIPLPKEVAPWERVDITVEMVAPAAVGTYRSYWKLRSPDGQVFGMGDQADEAIWVEIKVESSAALDDGTTTGEVSQVIASVSLAVNDETVYSDCPHTFVFTAQFTLNKAVPLTYALEAGDTGGSTVKVPPPSTRNLDAGTHAIVYELSFPSEAHGWARLHIIDPEETFSNQVNFTLTC